MENDEEKILLKQEVSFFTKILLKSLYLGTITLSIVIIFSKPIINTTDYILIVGLILLMILNIKYFCISHEYLMIEILLCQNRGILQSLNGY